MSGRQEVIGLDEAAEQGGHLGGAGDLLEPQDRPGQLAEGVLVDLEPVGDDQGVPRRAEKMDA